MPAHRTRAAEQTRDWIRPQLDRFGITRVADITRLDHVGLPVHVAYRPGGTTLAVSIGIGLEPAQSWVSAVMESIEVWHAENYPAPDAVRAAARELDLPYPVGELDAARPGLLTERTVLDWVGGVGLLTGADVAVPAGVVRLDATERGTWEQALFDPTSNGTATGNTRDEAVLHGLLEVIERDCCAPVLGTGLDARTYIDPGSLTHPDARAVLDRLGAAGCTVELCSATNAIGVPACACALWAPDLPLYFTGFGCHPVADLAAARAMSEAALSRLATVSGARDDIDQDFYDNAPAIAGPDLTGRDLVPIAGSLPAAADIGAVIHDCARRVRDVTGVEPIVVDLTHPDIGIAAVKVVAPGLVMFDDRLVASRAA